ncbi:MAG: universal stress protein [Gammaproteobacteria bacterium]|nr:universal stress protein [Gammaproteobacteria bacterium]NNM00304.1 universal stress protein [Gammaproteobacteria bacterium]
MFDVKRILHPTDFSDCSARAFAAACDVAVKYGAELHLLHVVSYSAMGSAYAPVEGAVVTDWLAEAREQVERKLGELVAPAGVEVERAIAEGVPSVEIERYCGDNDIDLAVVGTHGRSGLPHLVIGSVAERLVRQAPCAVMTIKS